MNSYGGRGGCSVKCRAPVQALRPQQQRSTWDHGQRLRNCCAPQATRRWTAMVAPHAQGSKGEGNAALHSKHRLSAAPRGALAGPLCAAPTRSAPSTSNAWWAPHFLLDVARAPSLRPAWLPAVGAFLTPSPSLLDLVSPALITL